MARPRPLTLALMLLLALAGGLGIWKVWESQRVGAVRATLERYQRAIQKGDESGLRVALTEKAWAEFQQGGGVTLLPMIKGLSPTDGRLDRVEFSEGDRATAHLVAGLGTGTASLVREGGLWRVEKMAWQMSLDAPSTEPNTSSDGTPIPRDVQILLDRMAGLDFADAGRAWLELGGKYHVTPQFRRDLHRAFHDPRPIAFQIYYLENQSEGRLLRGYSTKLEPAVAETNAAQTVGEALRLDMWRMEGLGLKEGTLEPSAWWPAYAAKHRIASGTQTAAASSNANPDSQSAFPFLDPKIPASGEAVVTLDGRSETFQLGTSFWTDSRLKDPANATLEFRVPQAGGNPRRVRLRFNTTRSGSQTVDGTAVDLVYIADGGQMFPPQGPCEIQVRGTYTGGDSSLLRGAVPQVRIHSAGIDHTLALTFEVRGSFLKRP